MKQKLPDSSSKKSSKLAKSKKEVTLKKVKTAKLAKLLKGKISEKQSVKTEQDSSEKPTLQQLIEAAQVISTDGPKKNAAKTETKQTAVVAPSQKKVCKKGQGEPNLDPVWLQALGAEDLTEDGKKELQSICNDYEPTLLRGLFSRIASLEQYRSKTEQKATSSKSPENKSETSANINTNPIIKPKEQSGVAPIQFDPQVMFSMMMQQMYYQYMPFPAFNFNPNTGFGTSSEFYREGNASTKPTSVTNTTAMNYPMATSTSTISSISHVDPSNVNNLESSKITNAINNPVMPRKNLSGYDGNSNGQENQVKKNLMFQNTDKTSSVSVPHNICSSEDKMTKHFISSETAIDKSKSLAKSHSINKLQEKNNLNISVNSRENSVEKEINTDIALHSDDSNMSVEYSFQSNEEVKSKKGEDLKADPLAKFMQPNHTSDTPSFLSFVDKINDSSKSSKDIIENFGGDGTNIGAVSFGAKKDTDVPLGLHVSSLASVSSKDSHKRDSIGIIVANQKKPEVVAISDDDEVDGQSKKEAEVLEGRTYQNLTSVKKRPAMPNSKPHLQTVLAYLHSLPPQQKISVLQTLRKIQNKDTQEINASLQSLVSVVNAKNKRPSLQPIPDISPAKRQRTTHFEVSRKPSDINTTNITRQNVGTTASSNNGLPGKLKSLYLQDKDGDTVLHIAIAKENVPIAIDVIKKMRGFGLDIMNSLGQTPLHLAFYVRKVDIIRCLLHHGADASIVDGHGNSVLSICCEEDSSEMLDCLFEFRTNHLKYVNLARKRNNNGLGPLHIAMQKDNLQMIRRLVHYGVDIDLQEEKTGATVLIMAMQKNKWNLAKFFIKQGADVNIPTYSGYYPLNFAIQAVNKELVEVLLEHNAEIGCRNVEFDDDSEDMKEIRKIVDKEMRKRRRKRSLEYSKADDSPR